MNERNSELASTSFLARLQWPQSTALNLVISGVIGLLYALFLIGPARLNPKNTSWLVGDLATYYIGWTSLRGEPFSNWPLTFTTNVGYPHGTTVAFFDLNPLLAVLLRPFSPLLPSTFQWFGLEAVMICALQFFFGAYLVRYFVGRNFWAILLSGLFFMVAPVLTWRLSAHFALGSHWIILAAFYLFLKLQNVGAKLQMRLLLWYALLQGVAIGTNPYLGFMVAIILNTAVLSVRWTRKLNWRDTALLVSSLWLSFAFFAAALGFARARDGYTGGGYRSWSFNLLAPINPGRFGSAFIPSMSFGGFAHYEAYNYFGVGFLLLTAALIPSFVRLFSKDRATRMRVLACVGWCLLITLFAASTKITAGSLVVADLDPKEHLTKYLSVFRGSGRFFWAPYYLIMLSVLVGAFKVWKPRTATIFVAAALLLEFVDEGPEREFVRVSVNRTVANPFLSPIWSAIGKNHRNLMVEPPWQCGYDRSPTRTWGGFAPFGFLALNDGMRTNDYYSARYSDSELNYDCGGAIAQFLRTPLAKDSVYVVTPAIAQVIAAGPTGAKACHSLDSFILCAADTDFGLGQNLVLNTPALQPNGTLPPWTDPHTADFFVFGWNLLEPWGIWSTGDSLLQFRISSELQEVYRGVSLSLILPIGPKAIDYELGSDDQFISGAFPGGPTPRVESFNLRLPIRASQDGVHRIQFHTKDAIQPNAIGLNPDPRTLGLGLVKLTLVP